MSFERVATKLSFLRTQCDRSLMSELEDLFYDTLTASKDPVALASGARSGLLVDTVYALLRHRSWVQAPLFAPILVDALQQDYRIEKLTCAAVVQTLIDRLAELSGVTSISDKDFLRYIFVLTCTTAADENLITTIGLGRSLLERIMNVTTQTEEAATQTRKEPTFFASDLDALMADIISELAQDFRSSPDLFKQHRLAYALSSADGPLKHVASSPQVNALWRTLKRMGAQKDPTTAHIATYLSEESLTPENLQVSDTESLMIELCKRDLAFVVDPGRGKKPQKKWHLTRLGVAITS